MFVKAHQLVPGKSYRDTTGDPAFAVKYREYSTQSEHDLELVIVFPRSGRAFLPHLLGTLMFMEVPDATQQADTVRGEGRDGVRDGGPRPRYSSVR